MKTRIILLAIALFFSISLQAQTFNLSTFAGSGVKFDKQLNATLYQSSVTVSPQAVIGKFQIDGIAKSIFIDSTTELNVGVRVGYRFWEEENKSAWAGPQYTYSTNNALNVGIVAGYDVDVMRLVLESGYETKSKSGYVEIGIGAALNLIK